jgi:hypothetical protein
VGNYDCDACAIIDDIVTTKVQTDEEIVREIRNKNGEPGPQEGEDKEEGAKREETEEKPEVPVPTMSEALEALRVVNHFYESRAGNSKIVS